MRKTKIICTIGPATDNFNTLEQLADAGMNVVRLNMSPWRPRVPRPRYQGNPHPQQKGQAPHCCVDGYPGAGNSHGHSQQ